MSRSFDVQPNSTPDPDRVWHGLTAQTDDDCVAVGRPATLSIAALDYDGGCMCWVRFSDGGELTVVPGSRVEPR